MNSQPTGHLGVLKNSMRSICAFQIKLEFESVGFWGVGKLLGARERTDNKLNPFMAHRFGVELSVVDHGVNFQKVSGKSDWKMSKWDTMFWVFPAENFWDQRNVWKGSPFLREGMLQTWILVPLWNRNFLYQFKAFAIVFGKRNWIVQMLNTILGRNLVASREFCLPFAQSGTGHVNGKQPWHPLFLVLLWKR